MSFKGQFPFFKKFPSFIYADSAATTLKPYTVLKALVKGYTLYTVPAGKSLYSKAEEALEACQIFTKETINRILKNTCYDIFFGQTVSILFDRFFLLLKEMYSDRETIKILVPLTIHNAIILPVEYFFKKKRQYLFFKNIDEIKSEIQEADIVIIPSVDHVTGEIISATYIELLKKEYPEVLFIIDASQSFSTYPYSLKNSSIDAIVWSSHKMYGPDNIAILMIKKKVTLSLSKLEILENDLSRLESFFKCGSFSYPALFAFQKALFWTEENIYKQELYKQKRNNHINILLSELQKISSIKLISHLTSETLITFTHSTINAHDIALLFSKSEIGIRSGDLCTRFLPYKKGLCRISLGIYNTEKDILTIKKAIKSILL